MYCGQSKYFLNKPRILQIGGGGGGGDVAEYTYYSLLSRKSGGVSSVRFSNFLQETDIWAPFLKPVFSI